MLRKICSQSKADIVDQLVKGIDGGDLQECREYVFKVAVGIHDEQLEAKGLPGGRARLELKQRRGETVNEKCASDMVELVLYVCGLTKYFPRDILSSRSTYVDIEPREKVDNVSDKVTEISSDNALATLVQRCDEYDRRLRNAEEYIMNVERVLTDEIKELKTKTCVFVWIQS